MNLAVIGDGNGAEVVTDAFMNVSSKPVVPTSGAASVTTRMTGTDEFSVNTQDQQDADP